MVNSQAKKIATELAHRKIIETDSLNVYAYGFELMISATINILLLLLISIVFRHYFDWLFFLIAFIPLRSSAGGYHANSHLKCTLIGSMSFMILIALSHLQFDWVYVILGVAAISFLMILLFSPIEAKNKKLSIQRRKRNRIISICISTVNLGIALLTLALQWQTDYLHIYFAGVFAAVVSMLVVKVKFLKGGE